MGMRQREWAKRKTAELREQLGGACVDCGATEELQFDCIRPQGDNHHERMEWSWRLSFYRQQHAQGNLALRCIRCNGRKQDRNTIQTELNIARHFLRNWRVVKLEYVKANV